MTYLVLARKWRPRSFSTLVGQEHVVRALTHALQTQRLHHAWLFTGTRGVGKTTLSRLLAKSLNCEQGITATPCGQCRACVEIDEGRFVDYVELDAASNRGVDEMTQLLEQAVYAPSVGRFKVYMIDEVHMLTGHAFNAMLKTLEEPPAHVKFILATTDPQKIPVTVLSRCLQFNLKQMTADAIVGHLQGVLQQEDIPFEVPALRLIAQAASGSMRDALSLTDQAIAYSAGQMSADAVRGMLGTIDQRYLVRLLDGLAAGSGQAVLDVADELATRGLSYSGALADLSVLLSRIAIEQRVAGVTAAEDPIAADIVQLAQRLPPDAVQLFYTVAVHSRNELALSPDEYAGFVMACLRMLSLSPAAPAPAEGPTPPRDTSPGPSSPPQVTDHQPYDQPVALAPSPEPAPAPAPAPILAPAVSRAPAPAVESGAVSSAPVRALESEAVFSPDDVPAWEDIPDDVARYIPDDVAGYVPDAAPAYSSDDDFETMMDAGAYDTQAYSEAQAELVVDDIPAEVLVGLAPKNASKRARSPRLRDMDSKAWPALAAQLPATGVAAELARQSEWVGVFDDEIQLRVAIRLLAESPGQARLCTLLSEHFGTVVRLKVEYGATGDETAHAVEQAELAARQQAAEQAVGSDSLIQALVNDFQAKVIPGSIRPIFDTKAA